VRLPLESGVSTSFKPLLKGNAMHFLGLMLDLFLALVALFILPYTAAAQGRFFLKDGDRVVFYGASIRLRECADSWRLYGSRPRRR
jgi:hypothetical protein